MATHLDAINRARGKFHASILNSIEVQSQVSANGREGMEAASSAIGHIVSRNTVADFNNVTGVITLTPGQSELQRPSDGSLNFDVNKITEIAIKNVSTGKYKPLQFVSDTQAVYKEPFYLDDGKPKYAYIRSQKLYLLPAPDIAYDVQIKCQKVNAAVTSENVLQEIGLEGDIYEAYVFGIYAFIRQTRNDPKAGSLRPREGLLGQFLDMVDLAERNDLQTTKRRGLKQLHFVTRNSRLHSRSKRTGRGRM